MQRLSFGTAAGAGSFIPPPPSLMESVLDTSVDDGSVSVISASDQMSTASNSNKRPPQPSPSTPISKRRKEEDRLRMRVLEAQLTYYQLTISVED